MLTRRVAVFVLAYVLAAPALFLGGFRYSGGFRVELGAADDESYRLGAPSSWGRPYEDRGPFRVRRGVRWMTTFAARMAYYGAGLRLPDVVRDGNAELALRMHRYGRPGLVRVFGDGVELGRLRFETDSYPWDVRLVDVPAEVARDGIELTFALETLSTDDALARDGIAAFDWIELRPAPGAELAPTAWQTRLGLAYPLLVYAFAWWGFRRRWLAEAGAGATTLAVSISYAVASSSTSAALAHLWLAFPLALAAWAFLRFVLGTSRETARPLSAAFALVLLVHSTLIFSPRHLPPDVRAHQRQLRRLDAWDGSRDALLEISSSYGKDGRTLSLGRAHPRADYAAPYSPWTYAWIQLARRLVDQPRFLLEYLAMIAASISTLLAFALARHLAKAREAAWFTLALSALDVTLWHHASRAHTPAVVGQTCLLAATAYLVARHRELSRWPQAVTFGILSLIATLSYSATLLHFVVFIFWLTLLDLASRRALVPSRDSFAVLAPSVAGTLGAVALFYRYFIGGGAGGQMTRIAPADYRAPATFWLLRNQPRDTVRLLSHGAPAWTLLALPAYLRLEAWSSDALARRVIWAWTAAVLTFFVLKDPAVLPQVFLQVKEDLFGAALWCVLGGMTLAALSGRGRAGQVAVGLVLAALASFQLVDFLSNADTIPPP